MSSKSQGAQRALPFIIIGVVLVAIIAAMLLMSRASNQGPAGEGSAGGGNTASGNGNAASRPTVYNQPQPGAPRPHTKGGDTAAVTLEEFSDFQCPACGRADPALRRIEKDYAGRVRIIFRNFPLQGHKYAFLAARAAEAAGLQGKFWEMHHAIYDDQAQWSEAPEPRAFFDAYATRLGLDVQKFKADMERADVVERIKADYSRGLSLNVKGTPTIFLNGRELPAQDTLDEARLRAQIDAALAATTK